MTGRSVLFVSHEGTRTGAPMMLLHFLRWARDHTDLQPEIALLRGGPLAADFAEVGPTHVLSETPDWPQPTRAESQLTRVGLHGPAWTLERARLRRQVAELRGARTAYLNSIASLRLLHHLPNASTVITHVHELQSALQWSMRRQDPLLLGTRVGHFVAAADCVAANLVERHGIDPGRVTRVYEFIDPVRTLAPPVQDRAAIRDELGIGDDEVVVGGSGFADWRKGIDLFVELARQVGRSGRRDVHFVWVGDRPGGEPGAELDFDIARAGVADRLHLVGLRDRPFDWYRAFDVLALTSREDPYPLVGLETSLLEVPMVCFDAGGMTELVARSTDEGLGESGVVVGYLDVEAMADAVLAVLDDPDRRRAMGRRARAIVERDHSVEVAGPELHEVIERVCRSAAP